MAKYICIICFLHNQDDQEGQEYSLKGFFLAEIGSLDDVFAMLTSYMMHFWNP